MNKDIPSYELCMKLKELGYEQDVETYRYDDTKDITICNNHNFLDWFGTIAAPTIGEMMDVLPATIKKRKTYHLDLIKREGYYRIYYILYGSFRLLKDIEDKSLPNALAKMLIRCIEEGHIDMYTKPQ